MDCPHDCPCERPKQRLQSQQQPSRSIEEVEKLEGFTRKNEDGREADRRLANRRLQPLGHLTVDGPSIRDAASDTKYRDTRRYGAKPPPPTASARNRVACGVATARRLGTLNRAHAPVPERVTADSSLPPRGRSPHAPRHDRPQRILSSVWQSPNGTIAACGGSPSRSSSGCSLSARLACPW